MSQKSVETLKNQSWHAMILLNTFNDNSNNNNDNDNNNNKDDNVYGAVIVAKTL